MGSVRGPIRGASGGGVVLVCCAIAALQAAAAAGPGRVPPSHAGADPGVTAARPQVGQRPAKGRFLIARRGIGDPRFSRTVILLVEHDASGSLGLTINRPSGLALSKALPDVDELSDRSDIVYLGGPVSLGEMRLLVEATSAPEPAGRVFSDVYVSGSVELLEQLAGGAVEAVRFRAYAGYSGWGQGQLDLELLRGDWHLLRADATSVFETPSAEVWPDLIERVGQQVAHLFWHPW